MASTYLGQFTDENAERIAEALEGAGLRWYAKSSGQLVRTIFAGDWGTRLFVAAEHVEDAREIAGGIAPDGLAKRRRR